MHACTSFFSRHMNYLFEVKTNVAHSETFYLSQGTFRLIEAGLVACGIFLQR